MTDELQDEDDQPDKMTPARFWEAAPKMGRPVKFRSTDHLWDACLEYVTWAHDNPLIEGRPLVVSGKIVMASIPKMRAMTLVGMCNFLGIGFSTWDDYRKKPEFSDICARVEQILRQQKFEGAAADMLNPSIIARDLGLAEKSEHSGPGGGPIQIEDMARDADEFARRMAVLAARTDAGGNGPAAPGSEGGA